MYAPGMSCVHARSDRICLLRVLPLIGFTTEPPGLLLSVQLDLFGAVRVDESMWTLGITALSFACMPVMMAVMAITVWSKFSLL